MTLTVIEADLQARHWWLVQQAEFRERMLTDPNYYDIRVAGWWVWGISAWIGSGWCKVRETPPGQKKPSIGKGGTGVHRTTINDLHEYMRDLARRLRRVRVCCGNWDRVLTKAVTHGIGMTAVLLDPPYSAEAKRTSNLYANDDLAVSHATREWAIANGSNPQMRIALCGYEGEHQMPGDWECVPWKTNGGYSNQSSQGMSNRHRERIWFSPRCLRPEGVEA